MVDKINVQIIQPVVPKYREPLYKALIKNERFKISIHCAETEPFGVKTISNHSDFGIDISHDILCWNKKIFWQRRLRLNNIMSKGDVLVINGNLRYLSNIPLIIAAKIKKISIVWWGHGWSPTSSKLRYKIRKIFMPLLADYFLLYTEKEKKMFIEEGFKPEKIFFMNNTIDSSDIFKLKEQFTELDISEHKKKMNLENHRVLLFCGRLRNRPSVSLNVAIKAINKLNNSGNNQKYILIIIGDGPEYNQLVNLSKKLEVDEYVLFLGEIYSEEELAPWFLSADCFVYPGPIGLSLLHAFSYSLPVITHNVIKEHNPEIAALRDGVNGLLFEKDQADDLANKIGLIYTKQSAFRMEATRTIMNEFSFDNYVSRVSNAIINASGSKE